MAGKVTPFDGNGLQPPEARSFLCGFNCFGAGLTKESGLCFLLCLLAEWFVPAAALKSCLLNSPLFLRLEWRHGLFSLFPVSVCLTLSALLWFNTACFEKPSVNGHDLCLADSPVTEACDCPEQSRRDTGLPVHLIRFAHWAGVDARQRVESV